MVAVCTPELAFGGKAMNKVINDIGDLQTNYQALIDEKRLSKKAMCDLVIPFRDKYGLTDLQALQIARNELTIAEINLLILQN